MCYFPIGILGQVWNLIVSIPDLCPISYFSLVFPVPHYCLYSFVPLKTWQLYPSSPEINVFFPLFPQTPGRASVICRLPCENRGTFQVQLLFICLTGVSTRTGNRGSIAGIDSWREKSRDVTCGTCGAGNFTCHICSGQKKLHDEA